GCVAGSTRAVVHVNAGADRGAARDAVAAAGYFAAARVAEVNAVKRLLRAAGPGHLSKSLGTDAAWGKLPAALATEPTLRTYVTQHHALRRCAQEQMVALEENARRPAGDDHQGRGAPPDRAGVGPIVALTAVAVFSDVHSTAATR